MRVELDTARLRAYAAARREFLSAIGIPDSLRDPLAEFSERIVAMALSADLSASRVQKGHDLVRSSGRKVQVKYLANPAGRWRNEHRIEFAEGVDDYALVVFENLDVSAVLVFPRETLARVCALLGKKHGDTDRVLQFTQANYRAVREKEQDLTKLAVEVYTPSTTMKSS